MCCNLKIAKNINPGAILYREEQRVTTYSPIPLRPYIIAPPLLTPSPPPGSFWAERLLGAEDSEGAGRRYEDSDLTRLAPDLGSNRVLLAHGTRDPAAHHAFLLSHSFIAEGSYFTHVVGRLGQGRLAPLGGVVEGERGFTFTFWPGSVGS